MTRSGFFFLLTLCLSWTAEEAGSANPTKTFHPSSRFGTALDAATKLLWKSFSGEGRIQDNFLLFPVPFARDVAFIESLLDEAGKGNARKMLPLYEGIDDDLRSFGNELRNAAENDTRFKTILYINSIELYQNLNVLFYPVYKNPANPKDSFLVIVHSGKRRRALWTLLSQSIGETKLGVTCDVRFCGFSRILSKKRSFAMITLSSWRIREILGFQWSEMTKFAFYETHSTDVHSLRSVANFDYAKFKYPQLRGCTGRALRVTYNSEFDLTFVIPSEERNCSTLEELWTNFQSVDLIGLKFSSELLFVSVPVFKVSAHINVRSTLRGTELAKPFTRKSSKLYKALAFHAAEFVFDPRLPASNAIPMISPDTPRFLVDRPFFLSIAHISSGTTVFAGLVLYPGCIKECPNQPRYG